MARGQKSYSPETKAAVMAALLEGQSVNAVAREYKIPKGTVSDWKTKAYGEVSESKPTQKSKIGDLLIQYVETSLETLNAQAEMFRDRSWLAKQGASEMATLHGVMTDKVIRLVEAFGEAE